MRAVKEGLPTPFGEGEELEGPRSTAAVGPTRVSFLSRETSELGMIIDGWCSFDARNGDHTSHLAGVGKMNCMDQSQIVYRPGRT